MIDSHSSSSSEYKRADTPDSTALLLSNPSSAWHVKSGYADIFLIEQNGPRRYLMRIEAGEIFTGLGTEERDHRRAFAFAGPGAQIEPSPSTEILPLIAIERWILTITHSFGARHPMRTVELIPGQLTAFDRRAVAPKDGVCWAAPIGGEAHFLGNQALLSIAEREWLPVTSESWLEPKESLQFDVHNSEQMRASGEMGPALERFYRSAVAYWNAAIDATEARHRKRAADQRVANRARMAEAIESLAATLSPHESTLDAGDDPWMACCRKIGKAAFIEFQAPSSELLNHENTPAQHIAQASGVRTRKALLAAGWWKEDHGPLLTQMREDRMPVALLPVRGGYRCYHAASKKWSNVSAALASELDPFALLFYRPLPPGPVSGRSLLRFALHDSVADLRTILGISVATSAVALALPVVTGVIFDHILPQAERGQLALICALLMTTAVANSLFNLTRGSIILRLEGRVDARLQAALWGRLLDLPPWFNRRFSSGDLASRGLGIQTIRDAVTGAAANSLLSAVFSLVTFALLFTYSAPLAMAAAVFTLAAMAVTMGCGLLQIKYQRQLAEIGGRLSGLTLGMVHGIAKLRIAAAEPRAFFIWSKEYSKQVSVELAGRRVKGWLASLHAFWLPFCTALIFYLYLGLLKKSTLPGNTGKPLSAGDLIAFLSAFSIVINAVLGLAAALMDLIAVGPAYERARPILEADPEDSRQRSDPGPLTGTIELRNVTFRYQDDLPPAVRNVSIEIRPQEFIAIVGSSGSGKSTLLRLLLGFESPQSGTVLYDGRDLRILDPRAVRRQVGVVLQDGGIQAGSIYKNIVGAARFTLDDAWEAARMAGLDGDIEALPMGMHTPLGEGGGTLSGGQRQRLLIARALVRQPRILFFDEATSALDNATQAIVSRSLDRLQATRIVIAHRLSTVERADRICVMQRGVLVEEGNFKQLMAHGGVFAELAKRQMI